MKQKKVYIGFNVVQDRIIKKYLKTLLIITLILGAIVIPAFRQDLKIVNYEFKSKKVSGNIKLCFIVDLHSCQYGRNQSDLIKAVDKQKPDAVLFGGDIYDYRLPDSNADTTLKTLADKYPCYYVTGNHEFLHDDVNALKAKIKAMGVKTLNGDISPLKIGNDTIQICGVDDPLITDDYYKKFQDCKKNSNDNQLTVMIFHRPEEWEIYNSVGFDIVLTGHAHGGQIRIPFLLNGLWAPVQGFLPKHAGGRYDFSNTTMIVSRGLARESTAVPRVFNRPELVFVNIQNG